MSNGERHLTEQIPATLAGQRVDRVVAMVADVSRAAATELVATGRVLVDGVVPAKGSERLTEDQTIDIHLIEAADGVEPDPATEVPLVHVDDEVIVVDKPAGMIVHPGAGVSSGTMVQGLLARFPEIADVGDDPKRPGILHRLDKGTSGLLLVGRTQAAFESLSVQLRRRTVLRRYRTLVWGNLETDRGMIDAPIGRSNRDPTRQAIIVAGRQARTHYEVLGRWRFTERTDAGAVPAGPVVSELACRLETGRTHQIRVHLESIGHPVVADPRYGHRPRRLGLERPFLHAERLGFRHPSSGNELVFDSPLPPDLGDLLERLEPF